MSKLNDIPRKQIFTVPEGFFEKLPAQIQARVTKPVADTPSPVFRYAVRYALPLVFIAAILLYLNRPTKGPAAILATVDTEELIQYLHDSELTTEDILENIDFYNSDLEAIEGEIYNLEFNGTTDDTESNEYF